MDAWLSDSDGNKCSVSFFGSLEAAQAALDSLKNCRDCVNCLDCSDCVNCSYFVGCVNCSGRSGRSGRQWGEPKIPKIDDIHKKVFAAASQPGALSMTTWHTCETTHCRAGWVIALAGEDGADLERFLNTVLAAHLIYFASGYSINPCRFYESNEAAMADMKRLAEES